MMDDKDTTELVNRLPDPIWECPHCHRKNELDTTADEFLEIFGVYKLKCSCCRIHTWKLTITDEFKEKMKGLFEVKRMQSGSQETSLNTEKSMDANEGDAEKCVNEPV